MVTGWQLRSLVYKTYSHLSDDTTTKSFIDLRLGCSDASCTYRHPYIQIWCLNKSCLAQKSNNKTSLGFRPERLFLWIPFLLATLLLIMWALKSPKQNDEVPSWSTFQHPALDFKKAGYSDLFCTKAQFTVKANTHLPTQRHTDSNKKKYILVLFLIDFSNYFMVLYYSFLIYKYRKKMVDIFFLKYWK